MATMKLRLDEVPGSYATINLCATLGRPEPMVTIELPELDGTDRQVAWADRLRRDALAALVGRAVGSPASARETLSRLDQFAAQLQAWVNGKPTAKAWIDERPAAPLATRAPRRCKCCRQCEPDVMFTTGPGGACDDCF